jgi:hypothetical protein
VLDEIQSVLDGKSKASLNDLSSKFYTIIPHDFGRRVSLTHIHIHTHTYIHTYTHTYIHTYIQTHTHTHTLSLYDVSHVGFNVLLMRRFPM